jgi:hypothetical protein
MAEQGALADVTARIEPVRGGAEDPEHQAGGTLSRSSPGLQSLVGQSGCVAVSVVSGTC